MNRVTIPAVILFAVFVLPVIGRVSAQTPSRSNEVKSEFRAGMRYYNADKPDFAKAFPLILKAAKEGDAGAQAQVAYMYEKGLGVKEDRAKALDWATKSADRRNSAGQNVLGYIYSSPPKSSDDYLKAVHLYEQSSAKGDSTGEASLGWMYVHGYGVKKDYQKALVWFRRSIAHRGADGANDIAVSYFFGQGVPQSNVKALKWLYVAQAFPKTALAAKIKNNIINIEGRMTSNEIEQAHRLATSWLAKSENQVSSGSENKK